MDHIESMIVEVGRIVEYIAKSSIPKELKDEIRRFAEAAITSLTAHKEPRSLIMQSPETLKLSTIIATMVIELWEAKKMMEKEAVEAAEEIAQDEK